MHLLQRSQTLTDASKHCMFEFSTTSPFLFTITDCIGLSPAAYSSLNKQLRCLNTIHNNALVANIGNDTVRKEHSAENMSFEYHKLNACRPKRWEKVQTITQINMPPYCSKPLLLLPGVEMNTRWPVVKCCAVAGCLSTSCLLCAKCIYYLLVILSFLASHRITTFPLFMMEISVAKLTKAATWSPHLLLSSMKEKLQYLCPYLEPVFSI